MRHLRPLLLFALLCLAISPASASRTRTAAHPDQSNSRTLSTRGFGLRGIVKPGTTEQPVTVDFTYSISNPTPINESFSPDPLGRFGFWHEMSTMSATITETPTSRVVNFTQGLGKRTENFYDIGLRKDVEFKYSAVVESRAFTYERLALKTETHTSGPLNGWTVTLNQDARGRPATIVASKSGVSSRSLTLGYDSDSLLNSTSMGATGHVVEALVTHRDALAQITELSRKLAGVEKLKTSTAYDTYNRLTGVVNDPAVGSNYSFDYGYIDYLNAPLDEANRKIHSRVATPGESWTAMNYADKERLTSATLSHGGPKVYRYDSSDNRIGDGKLVNNAPLVTLAKNDLNQLTNRTLAERGFGIFGTVNPAASFYFAVDGVEQLPRPTREEDGTFFGAWPVDENVFHEAAAQINGLMRGTLARPGQSDAVAEKPIHLLVPPKSEVLLYDHAGNLRSDAFWSYSWDSFGHLGGMEHHLPFSEPDISADEIMYTNDADGRRIRSSHVVTRINGSVETVENEVSVILWAGWLPIMEERQWIKNDVVQKQNRRWFQWGPDRSGTLDAAGGIGGLVAIHEETMDGQWKRTLLPLQDGLGNVTAVLDASTNAPVAQYAYGPYGEYIGETGDPDACPFRWQTKWFTPATGQYYFGYRCYDPRLGRWLSRDPLREDGGYNLYAYCENDPVNGLDPLGLADQMRWAVVERRFLTTFYDTPIRHKSGIIEYRPGYAEIYGWARAKDGQKFDPSLTENSNRKTVTVGSSFVSQASQRFYYPYKTPRFLQETPLWASVNANVITPSLDTLDKGASKLLPLIAFGDGYSGGLTAAVREKMPFIFGPGGGVDTDAPGYEGWKNAGEISADIEMAAGILKFGAKAAVERQAAKRAARVFPTHIGGTGKLYDKLAGEGLYILRDRAGVIRYVGRGDAPARIAEHALRGSGKEHLTAEILWTNNLPKEQAISLEHQLINSLGGPQSSGRKTQLLNDIESMSPEYRDFVKLEFAADDNLFIETLKRAGLAK